MSNACFEARANVAAISPYQAGRTVEETAAAHGVELADIVKLDSNENSLGMPESAKAALMAAAGSVNRYPDGNAKALRRAAADFLSVSEDEVIVGNGSDEILGLIARVVLEPGAKCVYSQYSFSVYELSARENGAECVEVPANRFAVDLQAMAEAVDEKTRLVFLTNPNNPTGLSLEAEEIEMFLERVPQHCVVVFDEAYCQYQPEGKRVDSIALMRKHPNVLVTRTFSKAYGLAGLRAGFAVGSAELIEMMNRIRPPFNMNALAQAAAAACVADTAFLKRVYDVNRAGVEKLEAFFGRLELEYLPTDANFVMVRVGEKAREVNEALLKKGVMVRMLASYALPEWMRISVGSPEEIERFCAVFEAAYTAACRA